MNNRRVNALKFCLCCQQLVSASTEYRHRLLQAPPRIKATSMYRNTRETTRQRRRIEANDAYIDVGSANGDAIEVPGSAWDQERVEDVGDLAEMDQINPVQDVMLNIALDRNVEFHINDDDDDDDDDENHCDNDSDFYPHTNDAEEVEMESNRGESGLEFWDELGEALERDLATIGNVIWP
jgi:hypothetical protein